MLLALRREVEDALAAALSALDLPADDLAVEEPPADVDAVLATSVAYRVAEAAGAPPSDVAADLADAVDAADLAYVGRVTARGPYVNFAPSPAYYRETLAAAREGDYGRLEPRGERVVVEHTSSNPTGPIHVGRGRNTIVGDALANVLEFAGYDVERHFYVNDAGRQIAVLTWAVETFDGDDLPDPERDRADYDLVRYYRKGNAFLADGDPADVDEAETEIEAIMHGLEAGDDEVYERVQGVVGEMLSGMRVTLDRLPATFDEFVHETRFMRDGSTDDVVERLKDSEYAVYEDDAWQLELDDWGVDKNFVFLRSDGTTLYTTRDLAHHEWKFDNFDRAVTVLGEDQALHADQLRAALQILGNDTDRLAEVLYGWVNLPDGDMSTRKGTGVDLDDLLDEAVERARGEVEERVDVSRRADLDPDDVERIARQVGIGAVRYDVVAKQPTKAITFRWEEALDFEAQSAPYVQYVHARACGILEGADAATVNETSDDGGLQTAGPPDVDVAATDVDVGALSAAEERALLRTIARLPAVVEAAADELEPHQVATYTRDLAEAFNAFYRECPVLDADDPAVRDARLALTAAARTTVANALSLLGVAAPTRM